MTGSRVAIETSGRRIDDWLQLGLILLLVVGCWMVLKPFFTAILFSAVIAISLWPWFLLLRRRLGRISASLLGCLSVILVIIGPAIMLSSAISEGTIWLVETLRARAAMGPPVAPEWLGRIPGIGDDLQEYWRRLLGSSHELGQLLARYSEPLRHFAINAGKLLGGGLLQIVLSIFLLFFMFRDGDRLAAWLVRGAERVAGERATELVSIAQNTVVGVMLGVLGTALAQAMVAMLGFAIADVPAPFLLGALTFVLSMIPVGPPLVWGGAAFWLFQQGETGWAIFMTLYGLFAISAVDNVIKPLLIARSSRLPFALTLLGVIGGVLAFGFMGVFVGPMLLALAASLGSSWLALSSPSLHLPSPLTRDEPR